MPFCERCGNAIGPAAALAKLGLRRCESCGVHACGRCWVRASGGCPGCGVRVDGLRARFIAPQRGGRSPQRPRDRRAAMTVGAIVVGLTAFAIVIGNPVRPAGDVEGALGGPTATMSAAGGLDLAPVPSPTDRAAGSSKASTVQSSTSARATPIPGATPDGRSSSGQSPREPTPSRTPAATLQHRATLAPTLMPAPSPTPAPSPAPTPPPTPAPATTPTPAPAPTPTQPAPTSPPDPTPTAAPTPVCLVVPDLVGLTVSKARAAWTAAGFTGSFSPALGQNNKTVQTQSAIAGDCLPASTAIAVTYS